MTTYTLNKKVRFDYEILETFEAGLKLLGHEVKSIRNGNINLKGAYITFHNDEAYLTNANISKYKFAGILENYDPLRSRKLLLKSKEIAYLRGKLTEKGLTIVPLSVYNKKNIIKMEIVVARGKKNYDKRQSIKIREVDREIRRRLKDG